MSFEGLSYDTPEADLSVIDPEIEPAVGVGADPSFVGDRRSIAPIV
jgi:hypothetical protein